MWNINIKLTESSEAYNSKLEIANLNNKKTNDFRSRYVYNLKWSQNEKTDISNLLKCITPYKIVFETLNIRERTIFIDFKYGTSSRDGVYRENQYDAQSECDKLINESISLLSKYDFELENSTVYKIDAYFENI